MKKLLTIISSAILLTSLPLTILAAPDAFLGNEYPDVCIGEEIPNEMGDSRYPIARKYMFQENSSNKLGQLFTADDCGPERINQFYGGEDVMYEKDSRIVLKKKPTIFLRRLLKAVGYVCINGIGIEASCKEWSLEAKRAYLFELLLLKPYSKRIKYDDCTICG